MGHAARAPAPGTDNDGPVDAQAPTAPAERRNLEDFNEEVAAGLWPPDEATLRAMAADVEADGSELPSFVGMMDGDQRHEEVGAAVEIAWEMRAGVVPGVDAAYEVEPRIMAMARTILGGLAALGGAGERGSVRAAAGAVVGRRTGAGASTSSK